MGKIHHLKTGASSKEKKIKGILGKVYKREILLVKEIIWFSKTVKELSVPISTTLR